MMEFAWEDIGRGKGTLWSLSDDCKYDIKNNKDVVSHWP